MNGKDPGAICQTALILEIYDSFLNEGISHVAAFSRSSLPGFATRIRTYLTGIMEERECVPIISWSKLSNRVYITKTRFRQIKKGKTRTSRAAFRFILALLLWRN